MSRDAVLQYATPPQYPQTPRANWLAVFSFGWTFAVSPLVMARFVQPAESAARIGHGHPFPTLTFLALVVTPAVAFVTGYAATERGAGWDSPYRATGLAVWSAPVAWLLMLAGAAFCFGFV